MQTDTVEAVLDRLTERLPLAEQIASLNSRQLRFYRSICFELIARGEAIVPDSSAREDVLALAERDLVVMDADRGAVLGAYPVTTEHTPHKLKMGARAFHAMCAFDAVSVAPILEVSVHIESQCAATGGAIDFMQTATRTPRLDRPVWVGIAWQDTCQCAAHSLCRDMVFLSSEHAADEWRQQKTVSVLTLEDAIRAGQQFFTPVLQPIRAQLAL
ncbi:MAG: alkylmercury lyase family protein [Gammaproteobacteria bacterium]|nr:alkylmercury lyase family protein [Gammaproteobacteria bacterium]